jgi:flagellar hook protein FlgE
MAVAKGNPRQDCRGHESVAATGLPHPPYRQEYTRQEGAKAMNKAMFAGLSGTMASQTELDVIGNNIANSETTGFKQGRVNFADTYYETLRGGQSATQTGSGSGGVDPEQVGSGVQVASIQNLFDQGPTETTGRPLDAAIDGEGLFMVTDGVRTCYTRDGAFSLDDQGTLVMASTGMKVLGWQENGGVIDTTKPPTAMAFHIGEVRPGAASGNVTLSGNVAPDTATGTAVSTSIDVYDSLGRAHTVDVKLTKTANANEWTCNITSGADTATATVDFDSAGKIATGNPVAFTLNPGGGATGPQAISVDLSAVSQLAGDSNLVAQSQDGSQASSLLEVSLGEDGVVEGKFSDGSSVALGQVAVAGFANDAGLERTDNNLYVASAASGAIRVGTAGTGGRGGIVAQSLEQSNVDMTQSLVDMITTQRAFQASTRAISTADKLLDDVMQLLVR